MSSDPLNYPDLSSSLPCVLQIPSYAPSRFYWVQQVGYDCRIAFINQGVMGATQAADCNERYPYVCTSEKGAALWVEGVV